MAKDCLKHANDLSGLLLMCSSLGDAEEIAKLASLAKENGKNNVAFSCLFMLGKLEDCINRIPEAALMARSYLPSKVSEIVALWRKDLKKVNYVILTVCALGTFMIVSGVDEIKDDCLEAFANKEVELDELRRSRKADKKGIYNFPNIGKLRLEGIPDKVLGASVLKRHRQDESVDTASGTVRLLLKKQRDKIAVVVFCLTTTNDTEIYNSVADTSQKALTGPIASKGNTNYVILLLDIGLNPNTRGLVLRFHIDDGWNFSFCSNVKGVFECMRCKDVMLGIQNGFMDEDVDSAKGVFECLMDMREIGLAEKLFGEMSERDVVLWMLMMSGFLSVGRVVEARKYFDCMPMKNVQALNTMISDNLSNVIEQQYMASITGKRKAGICSLGFGGSQGETTCQEGCPIAIGFIHDNHVPTYGCDNLSQKLELTADLVYVDCSWLKLRNIFHKKLMKSMLGTYDAGLKALVDSAPALRSINLGCCSLLTVEAINNLADKLGPVLKELYIDECFDLDAKHIFFLDEAVAAYLEACGAPLRELSLNHVNEVPSLVLLEEVEPIVVVVIKKSLDFVIRCLKSYIGDELSFIRGLKESRRLKHGELNLVMGNRKIILVTKIGKYELMLKSGVRIDLNNCCYSLEMTRNIISFHALFKNGYKFSFDNENGDILVYSNGCFIFKASPCKGIYETVEWISHNSNVILNVGSSNELDNSKLWNSRLGHVNKKRIVQLQKDGVLESFDFKSDNVSESCLLGKMTKSPFMRSCKRGEGSLDLVHTDCVDHFDMPQKMEMLLRYGY
ncbi:retrotransposon protein, putative, ty1-copia subclass [Tanacetum coccineum]